MQINELGGYEVGRIHRKEEKRVSAKPEQVKQFGEVLEENTRAFSLGKALNDKEFAVNTEKVEQIKNAINKGEYQTNPEIIAKRMLDDEQKGNINLGLFSS